MNLFPFFLSLYLLCGIVLTLLLRDRAVKNERPIISNMPFLAMVLCTVTWPLIIVFGIKESIKQYKEQLAINKIRREGRRNDMEKEFAQFKFTDEERASVINYFLDKEESTNFTVKLKVKSLMELDSEYWKKK